MSSARDTFVTTPAGKIFTRIWGNVAAAVPIILFHDSLGSVELWRDFPALLASSTGHPVVAYDRLGFGKSDAFNGALAPGFISYEATVNLPALRRELGIDKMILFGHSVGGGMAVVSAGHFQDAAIGVITEAAQVFVEDLTLAGIREAEKGLRGAGKIDKLARYHGDKAEWVLDSWTKTWLSPAFVGWNLDDELRKLRCPVLALHGDRDEYGSREHPERIGRLAKARVVIFDDTGHIPHREKPDVVIQAVSGFIEAGAA